ncbi:hypothetical protein CEXT_174221 [Caerostris extrusa]|uniref:Uncharacterized protein n=1 Tax=Caerostris extrusa TaxID=172846 RepID=A0AAV4RBI4_CAEEX|nr:hypothetical protein CEXT_174221 [Caerostris extrusa]
MRVRDASVCVVFEGMFKKGAAVPITVHYRARAPQVENRSGPRTQPRLSFSMSPLIDYAPSPWKRLSTSIAPSSLQRQPKLNNMCIRTAWLF